MAAAAAAAAAERPLGHGSPAHKALVEKAQQAKKCLVSLLTDGSRDFDVMDQFYEEYRSYLLAADMVSGQAPEWKSALAGCPD